MHAPYVVLFHSSNSCSGTQAAPPDIAMFYIFRIGDSPDYPLKLTAAEIVLSSNPMRAVVVLRFCKIYRYRYCDCEYEYLHELSLPSRV